MMREYPAYGRTIASHIVRGQKPLCVGVLLSTRWSYFNHVPKICIKPEDWAIGRYEFGFLHGLHVVVVPGDDCQDLQLAGLMLELMRVGPRFLWVWNVDGSKVYDGKDDSDWPTTHAHWIHQLSKGEINFRIAKVAADVMEAAQRRAAARWMTEYQAIEARAGLEKALAFHLDTDIQRPDRVRELFADPWRAPDARAA